MNEDDLLRELGFPLAAALRLRAADAGPEQIAAALDIAPDAVDAQLELAAHKLARRKRERATDSRLGPTGAEYVTGPQSPAVQSSCAIGLRSRAGWTEESEGILTVRTESRRSQRARSQATYGRTLLGTAVRLDGVAVAATSAASA